MWLANREHLKQQVREARAGGDHASIGIADDRKERDQVTTQPVFCLGVTRGEKHEKAVKGVVDVSAGNIEIGDGYRGRHIGRVGSGSGPRHIGIDIRQAFEQPHLSEPGFSGGVLGIVSESPLIGSDGRRVVSSFDGIERSLVVCRQFGFFLDFRICVIRGNSPGDTVLRRDLKHLGEHLSNFGFRQSSLKKRRSLAANNGNDGRDGLRLKCLRKLRVRVYVNLDENHATRILSHHFF